MSAGLAILLLAIVFGIANMRLAFAVRKCEREIAKLKANRTGTE